MVAVQYFESVATEDRDNRAREVSNSSGGVEEE